MNGVESVTNSATHGPTCYKRRMTDETKSQFDKFKEAARELECDDDEARFDERVKKLVKRKPGEGKPE